MKEEDRQSLITLYRCSIQDVEEKLNILLLEIRHLQKFTAFEWVDNGIMKELAWDLDPGSTATDITDEEIMRLYGGIEKLESHGALEKQHTPSKRMLVILAYTCQMIKVDIYRDLMHLKGLKDNIKQLGEELKKDAAKKANTETKLKIKNYLKGQLIMRGRSEIYVRRIGDVRRRLAQEMDHLNPDLQSPTIRRRQEYGFLDNYLKELSLWTHRDLITLCREWKMIYPGGSVPATIQYWEYDYTSRNATFRPDIAHKKWNAWYFGDESAKKSFVKDTNLQALFVRTSYWMLDRPCFHPIIGHELAHRVIRDGLGRLEVGGLQHRQDKLSRLARRLIDVTEAYVETSSDKKVPSIRLVEEMLCDCLAASRYGDGYLYAWFLEMLSIDEFNLAESFQDAFKHYELEDINSERGFDSSLTRDHIPSLYLRGRTLLCWLKRSGIAATAPASELRKAVGAHLDSWLEATCAEEDQGYWAELGDNIEHAIRGSGVLKGARFLRDALKGAEAIHQARSKCCNKDWFMNIQGLPDSLKSEIEKELPGASILEPADIPWQTEWLANRQCDASFKPAKVANSLFLIGAEEYMFRTGNLSKLEMLYRAGPPVDISTGSLIMLDQEEHRKKWIERREKYLQGEGEQLTFRDEVRGAPKRKILDSSLSGIKIYKQDFSIDDFQPMSLSLMSVPAGEALKGYLDGAWEAGKLIRRREGDKEFEDCLDGVWEAVQQNNDGGCPQTQTLMGRYDRYSLEPLKRNAQRGYDFRKNREDSALFPPYSTRRKLVMRIGGGSATDVMPLLVMFVELKGPLFRRLFLKWLWNEKDKQKLIQQRFLSYGWADFVLFLGGDGPVNKDYFEFIKKLYDHPMVNRTESLFTEAAIKKAEAGKDTSMIFNIRVKENKKSAFEDEVKTKIAVEVDKPIGLAHTTGRMDYHVWIEDPSPSWTDCVKLRKALLQNSSIARIETDIKHKTIFSKGV